MSAHDPIRPEWTCGGCGLPWPCQTRQRELIAEFLETPTSLHLYMAAQFVDAAADLPDVAVGDLYTRFIGWVRIPPAQ